jgi:hypothetical protein
MNKITLVAVGALCALAAPAHAVIINLGVFPQQDGGSNPEAQRTFLNDVVLPAYNAVNNPDLAPAITSGQNVDVQVSGGPSSLTINLGTSDFEYLKIKWGNFWQYFAFTGNETGEQTFNQPLGPGGVTTGGASHYDLWHSSDSPPLGGPGGPGVPEGGVTIAMFGMGLTLLALVRRRLA